MKVVICSDSVQWDAFVEGAAGASNYHRWAWREAIAETFGHEAYYLAATEDGIIQGVLPLFSVKSRLFGRFLVSVPFFSYGGVLANNAQAQEMLLARAIELAQQLDAAHIELRQGDACAYDWVDTTAKVTMIMPLPATVEGLWEGLSTGMRNKIRGARKHGLRSQWNGIETLDVFYRIFATNMRNLGTPVYPREWFLNLCRRAGKGIRILTLWDDGKPVAGGIATTFRNSVDWPWSATLPGSHRKYSAVFLYWALLEWALENGYRCVDFGRCTRGSGNYEFKRHWGPQERELHWYYWLAPGVPVPNLRPDNPRYHFATRVWKRLPLYIANRLGPRIVRSIP